MTKRRKAILRSIDDGNFGFCHLYDRFNLSYTTLKKHVSALETAGFVDWDLENDHGGTFTTTAKGREFIRPIGAKQ